mgnify:FL=1
MSTPLFNVYIITIDITFCKVFYPAAVRKPKVSVWHDNSLMNLFRRVIALETSGYDEL